MSVASVAFSIPSPSRNSIGVGDFRIRAYGLMIALGVVLGVKLAQRHWRLVGGSEEEIALLAAWDVPVGIVGARRRSSRTSVPSKPSAHNRKRHFRLCASNRRPWVKRWPRSRSNSAS